MRNVKAEHHVEADVVTRTLALELPEELIELLGSPEASVAKAKEALVLELLREARISRGKAAHLLGLTGWEILDLMAQHAIVRGWILISLPLKDTPGTRTWHAAC